MRFPYFGNQVQKLWFHYLTHSVLLSNITFISGQPLATSGISVQYSYSSSSGWIWLLICYMPHSVHQLINELKHTVKLCKAESI